MSPFSKSKNFSARTIRDILMQVQDLIRDPPEGIRVDFNDENIADIEAYIDGPIGTPYEGGKFKIKLDLDKDFPRVPPKAYVLTKIFHPNISATDGEICVNTLRNDWDPHFGIKHIFITIKCLLIFPNPVSALNVEAGKMLLVDYNDYALQAKMMTEAHAKPGKGQYYGSAERRKLARKRIYRRL